MMGHMGKAGYEEWREMRRDQQIDRGEIDEDVSEYKRSDTDGYKVSQGKAVRAAPAVVTDANPV